MIASRKPKPTLKDHIKGGFLRRLIRTKRQNHTAETKNKKKTRTLSWKKSQNQIHSRLWDRAYLSTRKGIFGGPKMQWFCAFRFAQKCRRQTLLVGFDRESLMDRRNLESIFVLRPFRQWIQMLIGWWADEVNSLCR